jgi:hypothetical protein
METVRAVYNDYKSQNCELSLMINCHGFGTSVGRETWESIIALIEPQFVIHIGTEKPEISIREPIQFLPDLRPPSSGPTWVGLSPIISIVSPSETGLSNPQQLSGNDYRWVKYAQHFRPDLMRKNVYKSTHPREFFSFPYCRSLIVDPRKFEIQFPFADEYPKNPLACIEALTVALTSSVSGQCICLAFVWYTSPEEIHLIIPPNILDIEAADCIVKGDVSWSPRERVCFKGKTTNAESTGKFQEPYYLSNVLGGDDTGAKQASSRADLKRRRLSPS